MHYIAHTFFLLNYAIYTYLYSFPSETQMLNEMSELCHAIILIAELCCFFSNDFNYPTNWCWAKSLYSITHNVYGIIVTRVKNKSWAYM